MASLAGERHDRDVGADKRARDGSLRFKINGILGDRLAVGFVALRRAPRQEVEAGVPTRDGSLIIW